MSLHFFKSSMQVTIKFARILVTKLSYSKVLLGTMSSWLSILRKEKSFFLYRKLMRGLSFSYQNRESVW